MKDKIIKEIFSLSGLSIIIGLIGFLSSIVTIFINVNDQLSVKWFLLLIIIAASLIFILLKLVYDLSVEKRPSPPFEIPIKYIEKEGVFVIRRNENFVNNIILGCYAQIDEIDRLAYLAVVHIIQDKIVQVKIRADFGVLDKIPSTQEELKNIAIRSVVPISALEQLNVQVNDNV